MKPRMAHPRIGLALLALALGGLPSLARESEGRRTNSVLLNGSREFVRGEGDQSAAAVTGQEKLRWRPVTLPGPFTPWNQEVANRTEALWARRDFTITRRQAATPA